MQVRLMVMALIGTICLVFGAVIVTVLRAPEAPPGRGDPVRLACRFDPVPRGVDGAALLPDRFEIELNGDYNRSYLHMTDRTPRLSILRREDGTASYDNVTRGQPGLTLEMAPDGTFRATLWQDLLRGQAIAEGAGRCRGDGAVAA